MALTKKDLEQIAYLLKEKQDNRSKNEIPFIDVLQKLSVALTATGVIWLVGSVSDMQRDIDVIKVTQAQNIKQIDDFREFTKKPRFTYDDFVTQVAPLKQLVDSHEYKLRERNEWMTLTSERVNKLESKYEVILEKLSTINSDISIITKSIKEER